MISNSPTHDIHGLQNHLDAYTGDSMDIDTIFEDYNANATTEKPVGVKKGDTPYGYVSNKRFTLPAPVRG